MQIIYSLPHVFKPGADQAENSMSLEVLLESLIGMNLVYLQSMKRRGHSVRPLYRAGVIYGRTIWWETIPALYRRGFGDCKSLTCALIAQYRFDGFDAKPVHRWIPNENAIDYHILVQTEKDGFLDPSRVLGMGKDENSRLIDF